MTDRLDQIAAARSLDDTIRDTLRSLDRLIENWREIEHLTLVAIDRRRI